MRIKKFTESSDLESDVRDIFSYVIDEFDGYVMVNTSGVTLIFDINTDYDQKSFKNLYNAFNLYTSQLDVMSQLIECLERLSISSDIYYHFSITPNGSNLSQLVLTVTRSASSYDGMVLLQKKV